MDVPVVAFNNGRTMPQLGLGVWQVGDGEAAEAVAHALSVGYRSVDTAAAYGNEEGVGRALADAGVDRSELFVTTKLDNADQGYEPAMRAFDASLERLGLDFVDLFLIHWPVPARDAYVDTWRAFEKIAAEGRAASIGVSNFQIEHLDRLAQHTQTVPVLNQVELHPDFAQTALRQYHDVHGIATEAWSPLGQGGDLLGDPVLERIAEAHGKTTAQVILRWHIQIGVVVIPKSVTPKRIEENIDVFDFTLSEEDMAAVEALDTGNRLGPHPERFG